MITFRSRVSGSCATAAVTGVSSAGSSPRPAELRDLQATPGYQERLKQSVAAFRGGGREKRSGMTPKFRMLIIGAASLVTLVFAGAAFAAFTPTLAIGHTPPTAGSSTT